MFYCISALQWYRMQGLYKTATCCADESMSTWTFWAIADRSGGLWLDSSIELSWVFRRYKAGGPLVTTVPACDFLT